MSSICIIYPEYKQNTVNPLRIILICLFLLTITFIKAQDNLEYKKDSLRQVISQTEGKEKLRAYTRLSYLYMSELGDDLKMDTLLTLFDEMDAEARTQGNISQQGMIRGNIIISFQNKGRHDEVIRRAPETLDFLAANKLWRFYYQIFSVIAESYTATGEYEQSITEAKKVYELAKEQKDDGGMAVALYIMANAYNHQKRWKEMEKSLRECIELLHNNDLYFNILTKAYTFLISSLKSQNRYDEALLVLPEFEKTIRHYEKYTNSPQREAWANFYIAGMYIYLDTGEYEKAGLWLEKVESGANAQVPQYELLRARALILASRKEYQEALTKIDSVIFIAGDQDIFLHNNLRQLKMNILIQMGHVNEAEQLFDDFIAAQDSIYKLEVSAQLDELRTQYEVDKHIIEKERNHNYFLFALGGCILLTVLLGIVIYYNRIITRKNRGLFRQIKEQDRLEDKLEEITYRYKTLTQSLPPSSEEKEISPELLQGDFQQQLLVTRLHEYLITHRRFANTEMNRDELLIPLATNRTTLSEAVKNVTGKTLMEYIQSIRVEEAKRMLDENPKLTMEAIAGECGMASRTFYRLFYNRYNITPSEYRKIALQAKN